MASIIIWSLHHAQSYMLRSSAPRLPHPFPPTFTLDPQGTLQNSIQLVSSALSFTAWNKIHLLMCAWMGWLIASSSDINTASRGTHTLWDCDIPARLDTGNCNTVAVLHAVILDNLRYYSGHPIHYYGQVQLASYKLMPAIARTILHSMHGCCRHVPAYDLGMKVGTVKSYLVGVYAIRCCAASDLISTC